jgi:hypothetical protein
MMAVTDGYRREEYPDVVGSKLSVLENAIEYTKPRIGYKIAKRYDDIEHSRITSFMGCPIITICFKGNEKLRFVSLENSKMAYEKIQARTKYRT